jgi:hypothetical protein
MENLGSSGLKGPELWIISMELLERWTPHVAKWRLLAMLCVF